MPTGTDNSPPICNDPLSDATSVIAHLKSGHHWPASIWNASSLEWLLNTHAWEHRNENLGHTHTRYDA